MSLSAQHVSSRSIGPFGFTSGRSNGHYQAVLPTSKSSMHLNLHKNVPKRIRPRTVLDNSTTILAGLKLLDKQRPKMKRFIGINFEITGKEQEELSGRLAQFNPYRFPAESKGSLPPIGKLEPGSSFRTYTEDEVKRLVCQATDKRQLSAEEIDAIVDRLACKPSKKERDPSGKKVKKFAAADVDALVERLARYDPEAWPAESRGKPARERDLSEVMKVRKQGASAAEVKDIVERLSAYDAKKWPPNSKPSEEDPREASSGRGKKVSGNELDEIVSRLASYDKKKWPPESHGMKQEYYQGKPLKQ